MANDPTTWFNWDLPNVGGDRNTWGGIVRQRWSDLDDMFSGKVIPNSKWITFASSDYRALVLSTEFEINNRAAVLFTDAADGVSSYTNAQFEFVYFGGAANSLILRTRSVADGTAIEKEHWRAKEQTFRFQDRVDFRSSTPYAAFFSPDRDADDDRAILAFGPTAPDTDADVGTNRRFEIEYDDSAGSLTFKVYDAAGAFVRNALQINSDGSVDIGNVNFGLTTVTGNNLNFSGADFGIVTVDNVTRTRELEYNEIQQVSPWPY